MQAVSGNSRAVLEELRAEGVEDHKLHLIYNGVDLEEFDRCTAHGDSRVDIGAADGDWILIHVANLLPYKGHADLLDGLASVQDRLPPNWRLWHRQRSRTRRGVICSRAGARDRCPS